MARIDSLLAIVVDQGANELRVGSDREPKMFAQGVPKKLNIPAMPEQTIRELLGEILSPDRAEALATRRPVEVTHEAGKLGTFHVTLTAREGGGLDVLFVRGKRSAAPAASPAPQAAPPASVPSAAIAAAPPAVATVGAPIVSLAKAPIQIALAEPLADLIAQATARHASDIHLLEGESPHLRIAGQLTSVDVDPSWTLPTALGLDDSGRARILAGESVDAGIEVPGVARLRLHVFGTAAGVGAAIRLLPDTPPELSQLNLPVSIDDLAFVPHGLVLLSGSTGSGKSTTLASLAQEALRRRSIVLVTLEDPIEYTLRAGAASLVRRRLVGRDTPTFASGLRDALREDPDVILVGEMRDPETISLALTAAETGHLVLSTIHGGSAASAVERIVDSYAPERQVQVRSHLADALRAIIVQRLVPRARGGRVPAVEVLRGTHAVSATIREGKTSQFLTLIQAGKKDGMISLERSLVDRVLAGEVRPEDARAAANDPGSFAMYLQK